MRYNALFELKDCTRYPNIDYIKLNLGNYNIFLLNFKVVVV